MQCVADSKNACLYIQENMAISCGSRAHLEKESVAQVIIVFCLLLDEIIVDYGRLI